MVRSFESELLSLAGKTVSIEPGKGYPEPGQASLSVRFSSGQLLTAEYWRVVEGGCAGISSFDHRQKYGLGAPIDAVSVLQQKLDGRCVKEARLDTETGDLLFQFAGDINLRVFNFTAYEIWEMNFPDGAVEYSNYNK